MGCRASSRVRIPPFPPGSDSNPPSWRVLLLASSRESKVKQCCPARDSRRRYATTSQRGGCGYEEDRGNWARRFRCGSQHGNSLPGLTQGGTKQGKRSFGRQASCRHCLDLVRPWRGTAPCQVEADGVVERKLRACPSPLCFGPPGKCLIKVHHHVIRTTVRRSAVDGHQAWR